MRHLESTKNDLIKSLIQLEKARERKKSGLFLVEGLRELNLALDNGYEVEKIFVCPDFFSIDEAQTQINNTNAEWISIGPEVADKLFYRKGIANVLGLVKSQSKTLDKLPIKENPLLLVIEEVEKPGNLGAMMRTADASGANGVIICDPATDIFNPNVVRSSLGCIFSVPIAVASTDETLQYLKRNKIRSFAAHLEATKSHFAANFSKGTAIVVGSEADGLTDIWRTASSEMIKIPMLGQHDSMNVSNAAAVLLYEAVRQRINK
jgi:RNA methyltransferase, TrmH family